jgi:hypothetical protein
MGSSLVTKSGYNMRPASHFTRNRPLKHFAPLP